MAGVDLEGLKDRDESFKPVGADEEWILASNYYEDAGRDKTRARLERLKVGLKNNPRPLEVSLLRRIIDRLAVTYDKAPTRWLRKNKKRLAESNTQHKLMLEALERAQYDLVWRRIDRLRALLGQVVVRFYASDPRGSVVLRVFEPFNVMRDPDPTAPDQMDMDRRFALRVAGDANRKEDSQIWEYWERTDAGWMKSMVDQSGELRSDPEMNPYGELPVMMVYDDIAAGRAWLPPRQSRTAWVEAINAMSNDLWNLIVNQAHSDRFFITNDTSQVPTQKGPGLAAALPADTQVIEVTPQPKITESRDVLETLVRLWSLSEDLPASEFDRSKQVVTGATLKVQEKPLLARRQAQVPLAREDERSAWNKFRAVHNVHSNGTGAKSWDVGMLDEDTSLEVEIPDVHQPVDPRELHDHMARAIALGSASMIDLIMREQEIPRARAIEWYERVAQDDIDYPPRANPGAEQEGPRMAGVDATPEKDPPTPSPEGEREEMRGKPSVIQAVKSA